ncbi:MAG: hypothetical protein IPI91_18765 [Flavobacteriales bacterium]|nr:hypothetical protein [Flavobacteriales bacterium]
MFKYLVRAGVVALVFFVSGPVLAGKLERAFEALAEHDYFRAKELFIKQIKKHPAGAWYGLSVITGRSNNPFFQLDSSHIYIERADAAFTLASDKERSKLAKVKVDNAALLAQRESVFGLAWEKALGQNSITGFDKFITTYKKSSHVLEAIALRDELAFDEVKAKGSSTAYRSFLEKYPNARQSYEARKRLDEAVYSGSNEDR